MTWLRHGQWQHWYVVPFVCSMELEEGVDEGGALARLPLTRITGALTPGEWAGRLAASSRSTFLK